MAKSRHKKSEEVSKNDGRKYNKRLAPKPLTSQEKTSLPAAKSTVSKKERLHKYGLKAIKERFGNETEFFNWMMEKSIDGDSFNHLKMFMEYTYGKASDSIDDTAKKVTKNAPVINFFGDNPFANKEQPKTIDVEHKEGEDENA